jgi:hypothetical protein
VAAGLKLPIFTFVAFGADDLLVAWVPGAEDSTGKLEGLLAEPVDTTVTGTNAATFAPYYEAGVFNHEVLNWPTDLAAAALPARKAALAGTRFSVDRLP